MSLARPQTGEIPLPAFLHSLAEQSPATAPTQVVVESRSTTVTGDRRSAIDAITAVAAHGFESSLLILGERGAGKSNALMSAYTRSAIRPVLVRANPAEAGVPLSGFSAVFSAVGDPRITQAAADLAIGAPDRTALFGAANEFLARLRSLDLLPTVVFIDDVDRMDADSREILGFIAGRVAGTGIRLIASATAAEGVLAGMTSLTLEPLTPLESMELVAAASGPGADEGTLQLIAQEGGGNALALVTALRRISGEQLAGRAPLELPMRPGSAVKAIVAHRLAGRSESELELLRAVALSPVSDWDDLLERSDDDVDALEELFDQGLLERQDRFVSCADPLVRSVLYWGIRHADRRRMHEEMLERVAGDDVVAAWHADAAGHGGAAELARAAEVLFAAGLERPAAEYAERALIAMEGGRSDAAAVIRLAQQLLKAGEAALGQRLLYFARMDDLAPAEAIGLLLTSAAAQFVRTGVAPDDDISTAVDLHQHLDPVASAKLLTFAAALHAVRWRTDDAEYNLARASVLMEDAGLKPTSLWTVTTALVDRLQGRTSALTNPVDATNLVRRPTVELLVLAQFLSLQERYTEARRVISLVLGRNRSVAPLWSDFVNLVGIENDIRAGELHRVLAVDADWPTRATARYGSRRALLRAAAASLADGALVADLLDVSHSHATAEHNPEVIARASSLRATLAVLGARFDDALEPLEWLESLVVNYPDPNMLRHRADLVETYAGLDRMNDARGLLARFEQSVTQHPSRWATLALARARAIVSSDLEAVSAFRAAVREFQPQDSPLEYARTLLAYARRLQSLGVAAEAERTYAAARAALEAAGAPRWASLVTAASVPATAVRRVQAVVPTLAALTDEEREIVERVRLGHRNGEIAAALFISLRTVELRLTRVYRKLGVKSRAHLVAVLSASQSA